jgi:hypothetical protein
MKTIRNIMIADNHTKILNYDDSLLYCKLLILKGFNDWRMPTLNEIRMWNRLEHNAYTMSEYEISTTFWFDNHPECDNINETKNIIPVRDI